MLFVVCQTVQNLLNDRWIVIGKEYATSVYISLSASYIGYTIHNSYINSITSTLLPHHLRKYFSRMYTHMLRYPETLQCNVGLYLKYDLFLQRQSPSQASLLWRRGGVRVLANQ